MSLFNEILAGRYNLTLRKLLNMKGEAPAPQISGDITADICLESDRPEWAYLGGEQLCSQVGVKGADVANFSGVVLFNTLASGVLATVEGILINNENAVAASFWVLLGPSTTPTGIIAGLPRDFRWLNPTGQLKRGALSFGSWVAGALTGQLAVSVTLPPGGSLYLPVSWILSPTTGAVAGTFSHLAVAGRVINSIVSATFFWRERPLEASEL